MAHWKKLTNPDYIGAYDFDADEERTLTVKKVMADEVTGDGGKKDSCVLVHFKEGGKPMVFNATNCKAISKMAKSTDTDDWKGVAVTIYVKNEKAFGEFVDCLRIKPPSSSASGLALPELIIGSENFKGCLAAVQGGTKIDKIKRKYTMSAEVEKALLTK